MTIKRNELYFRKLKNPTAGGQWGFSVEKWSLILKKYPTSSRDILPQLSSRPASLIERHRTTIPCLKILISNHILNQLM